MASKLVSYKHCLGINNRMKPEDIKQPAPGYNPSMDIDNAATSYEAVVADNIDINNSGMINSRLGYSLITTGIKNIWSSDNKLRAYCLKGADLCQLKPDLSTVVIMPGVGVSYMVFQQVNEWDFFSNGNVIGYIADGTASYIPGTTQMFRLPLPPGQCMEYFRGRIYVGSGNVLWFSDAFRYFRLDGRRNFKQFPDSIDLIAATVDGLYVAAGNLTYFLDGENPHKFELRPVAGYGAYRNSRKLVVRSKIGQTSQVEDDKYVSIWTATEGVVAGLPNGHLLNLSIEKFIMPAGLNAASMINTNVNGEGYTQFVTSIH